MDRLLTLCSFGSLIDKRERESETDRGGVIFNYLLDTDTDTDYYTQYYIIIASV